MKKVFVITAVAASALLLSCNQSGGVSTKSKLETENEQISYAIGQDMGMTLKRLEIPLDQGMVFRGIQDAMTGDSTKTLLTPEERQKAMETLMKQIRDARTKKDSLASAENTAKANEFLAKNKAEAGVITTASGLQYKTLQEGNGASPKTTDQVSAHYIGTLIDGTEFDNSYTRGQPASFPVTGVIPGWQELLPLMKVGQKVKCWIPPQMAYGPRSAGRIPPNSMLIFEVELIGIGAAQPATAPAGKPAPVAGKPATK